jgi:hypothetical protein
MAPRYVPHWRRPTWQPTWHKAQCHRSWRRALIYGHASIFPLFHALSSMASFPLYSTAPLARPRLRPRAPPSPVSSRRPRAVPSPTTGLALRPRLPGACSARAWHTRPASRRTAAGSRQATTVACLRCRASVTPSPSLPSRYAHVSLV